MKILFNKTKNSCENELANFKVFINFELIDRTIHTHQHRFRNNLIELIKFFVFFDFWCLGCKNQKKSHTFGKKVSIKFPWNFIWQMEKKRKTSSSLVKSFEQTKTDDDDDNDDDGLRHYLRLMVVVVVMW